MPNVGIFLYLGSFFGLLLALAAIHAIFIFVSQRFDYRDRDNACLVYHCISRNRRNFFQFDLFLAIPKEDALRLKYWRFVDCF